VNEPSYINLYKTGELKRRKELLYKKLRSCDLCPHRCMVDRTEKPGYCKVRDMTRISEYVLYPGEEPPLTGKTGAGGIFFSNCNMNCIYCQNFKFSQEGFGKEITVEGLSEIFLEIQNNKKAVNLDLITATAYLPFIYDALIIAIEKGFRLPIVWNTSSYESVETLKLLDGVVDIYLADIRYTSNAIGKKYSGVKDYWTVCEQAIFEMYRQIGNDFILDNENILKRGIILRILVLPSNIQQAIQALKFIKYDLSDRIAVSLMDQYVPVNHTKNFPEMDRFLKKSEYEAVVDVMQELELINGWVQEHKLIDD